MPIDFRPAHLTGEQEAAYLHLRRAYEGPEGGGDEVITADPSLQYAVGMLFPKAAELPETETDTHADVDSGDTEEPLAEEWRPSSAAISFVTDATTLTAELSFGVYIPQGDGKKVQWSRTQVDTDPWTLTRGSPGPELRSVAGVDVEVGCRWRPYAGRWLVTVHVRNQSPGATGDSTTPDAQRAKHQANTRLTMFQLAFAVSTVDGEVHEYDRDDRFMTDAESRELHLRFRHRRTLAVGHGLAARWIDHPEAPCTKVWLDAVPAHVVRDVSADILDEGTPAASALSIETLSLLTASPETVVPLLEAFVDAYAAWVESQRDEAAAMSGSSREVALRILGRAEAAEDRMREGVRLLSPGSGETHVREAFRLAMVAMRMQMEQLSRARGATQVSPPRWRPFQLGFLLTALASTADERHVDRALVDLIWFPTGGGKTEAYLGLAAFEMFLRRLRHGSKGGGTAVITRYTLRLLTSQQFQRAASLICAMEVLRHQESSLAGLPRFTIGLWVGDEVTPKDRKDAEKARNRMLEADFPGEVNQFQLTDCPWCLTPLLPERRVDDTSRYGVKSSGGLVTLGCVNAACHFHEELPVLVVDQDLYENPPTFLLGTVDKFAKLQFVPEAGRLLGLGVPYRQPSLLIQDELHLLSGPLGTTVAAFEAAIQVLLQQRSASPPKIVASTATIRSSDDQVRGLYGRSVALYPPAGLRDDESFFSRENRSSPGRLYIGLMPQSLPQATALVAAAAPLFELPQATSGIGSDKDAYWTTVLYHNSLRELGRTSTLLSDDVDSRLATRAARLGLTHRSLQTGGIIELTSRHTSGELRSDLRRLERRWTDLSAVDAVLSSNMLSVGIDVSRLALMLMVGQPKTNAEYIQATSRVGRGVVKGIVVTLFRPSRARDRSHFETFQSFHSALYKAVEPTSVTPWSPSSRERSLPGCLVTLARQGIPAIAPNANAGMILDSRTDAHLAELLEDFMAHISAADPREIVRASAHLDKLLGEWKEKARSAGDSALPYMAFGSRTHSVEALLRDFGSSGTGWEVGRSMRSVDPTTAIQINEPRVREAGQ